VSATCPPQRPCLQYDLLTYPRFSQPVVELLGPEGKGNLSSNRDSDHAISSSRNLSISSKLPGPSPINPKKQGLPLLLPSKRTRSPGYPALFLIFLQ
jgi:hypothetical protein